MGVGFSWSGQYDGKPGFSSNKSSLRYDPPNPDPFNSRIISHKKFNGISIVEIKYEGCTTFNGHKLLVLKKNLDDIESKNIDPHLLGKDHIVLARFEPNKMGWILAKKCAEEYFYQKEYI